MPGRRSEVQDLIAAEEVAAAELDRGELFLGTGNGAKSERALGIEEIAVGPADFGASALAGSVAELARDRV